MNLFEAAQKDMQMIMADTSGACEEVSIYPHDNTGACILQRGFFSNAPVAVKAGSMHGELMGNNPVISFDVKGLEQALGRSLSQQDTLLVRGVKYVCQTPRYSTYGMVTTKLIEEGKTIKGLGNSLLCQS